VQSACAAVRERLLEMASGVFGEPVEMLRLEEGVVVSDRGGEPLLIADVLGTEAIEETREFRHRQTFPLDPDTGQGDGHVAYAFAAHRAVVDFDTELGLVRVVEIACAQDVGKAMNPAAVEGQMHGGIAQGLGLALMEEIQVSGGTSATPRSPTTSSPPRWTYRRSGWTFWRSHVRTRRTGSPVSASRRWCPARPR
jgi:CO/xanthine dehydrogenase Mo-binding subunit